MITALNLSQSKHFSIISIRDQFLACL